MAARTVKKEYSVGQLVKWYESYADGHLTKDSGYGIIISVSRHNYIEDYINYKVCRYKHADIMLFCDYELEEVNK